MDKGRESPACSRLVIQSSGLAWDPVLRMNSEGRGSIAPTVVTGSGSMEFDGSATPCISRLQSHEAFWKKLLLEDGSVRHDVHHSTA